jgi:hypothetical protein
MTGYASPIVIKQEIFLPLFENRESDRLERILISKKVDYIESEIWISNYILKLQEALIENNPSLTEQNLKVTFSVMLDLLLCEGYHDLQKVVFEFSECMKCTSRYHYQFKMHHYKLPFEVHVKAFQVCKNLLHQGDSEVSKHVLRALPHVVDHLGFSADQQMELIAFVQTYSLSVIEQICIFYSCATLEHASPYFRSQVGELLLSYACNKKGSKETREFVYRYGYGQILRDK